MNRELTTDDQILSDEAVNFVLRLHELFDGRRRELLAIRKDRQAHPDFGFLPETREIRAAAWKVAPAPGDLIDRRVEITGPAEEKMIRNALSCGANVFMVDFEDSLSPTWGNVIAGQRACSEAVRRPRETTLVMRPRGWHLEEKHVPGGVSASLFDFGLYFFHNARELVRQGSGPYFYLPKLESHLEARLWNDVFLFAQSELGLPRGTIRATVLIETLPAAFEMDEILYELREHASGLNAGRWDYLFSAIKSFANSRTGPIFPDRERLTMTVPFMRAYTELLVRVCHRRGAHAMGGMSAFVPSRKDPGFNEMAFEKVRSDKQREVRDGFDGTWVAHPDLVSVAREAFDEALRGEANQKHAKANTPVGANNRTSFLGIEARDLCPAAIVDGTITREGFDSNIRVALEYLDHWLKGRGAVALNHLMEDAATAEIARSQLWQWVQRGAARADGFMLEPVYFNERLRVLSHELGLASSDAVEILSELILNDHFPEFLTVNAYQRLIATDQRRIHDEYHIRNHRKGVANRFAMEGHSAPL